MEISQVVQAGIKGSIAHPESAELIIDLLEANLVTEADLDDYVKKDGTSTVEKINLNTNPTLGTIEEGDLYYDENTNTVAIELPNGVSLHVSQEDTFIGQNLSLSIIPKGSIVYVTGTHNLQPRIGLARANIIDTTSILGIVAEDIPAMGKGLVLTRGLISGIDTDAFFTDSTTYLSDITSGGMISIPPTSLGAYTVSIGRVLVSSSSGKMYITFDRNNNLTDLADVDISSPMLDQVLRYNGAYWINGAETSTSPSVGANFFLDNTVVIPQGSGPQSLETFSLLKNPTVTSENILDITVNNSTSLIKYFMYDKELGGSFIDAGNWNFKTYASVSQTSGITTLPITVRKIVAQAGVIDIMGIGTSRTAYAVNKFLPSDFNADITLCTYIQTPNALLRITGYSNTNSVSVETLSTYVNETGVSFSKHINLFEDTPIEINSILPSLASSETTRAPYAINSTDKLAIAYYARTDSNINTTVSLYINGTNNASYFTTPIAVRHNDLIGLQGGSASERFHLTSPQYTTVLNTSGINTGDQDLSNYELNLNKSTSIVTDQASNTKYPSVKSVYDWATSTFESGIGYTAENVANKAINLTSPNNTKYPTTLAVQNAIDLLPTDHSELTGLSADDHTQYIRTDGTRTFTGDQSLGNNELTSVSLINGIAIEAHASRHLPNGADPLATGTPSTIGTSNSQGTANALARQDHVHSHGDQTSPTHHAIATTLNNGFMSTADKNKLDTVQNGATSNSTDAQLRDRSTHTGTQSYTTITGLGALATKNTIGTSDIIDGNVTNAKLADMTAFTIKGNSTASSAAPQDLSVATTKSLLSINNVDNTSDASKPVSTAQQTALNLKADIASPTFTGTVSGITKTMVGLSNVDNTSDATKNSATVTLTNKTLTSPLINTPIGIVKADVGLGNVDNTSDVNKPVSTAQQVALNLKQPLLGYTAANDQLSNLAGTSINDNLLPDSDGIYDIGASGQNWNNIQAKTIGYDGGIAINLDTKKMFDSATKESIDFESRFLKDSSSATSVQYDSRVLLDTNGNDSLNWQSRHLADNGEVLALDYLNRRLFASNGITPTIDWSSSTGPTTITQSANNNSTKIATTAYVDNIAPTMLEFFGSGTNGNLTLSGPLTLSQDVFYNTLTLNAGAALTTNGYRIFCKVLDLSNAPARAIRRDGTNGNSTVTQAGAGLIGALVTNTVGGSANGGAGATGVAGVGAQAGASGALVNANGGDSGAGGTGGNGTPNAGGAARAASTATTGVDFNRIVYDILRGAVTISGGAGAPGGSSGGGDGTNLGRGGGGGASGAGVAAIYAHTIITSVSTAAGAISCVGGNGGNGASGTVGNVGGGGGGGASGGGYVYIMYAKKIGPTITNLITAAGGVGGNAGNGFGTGLGGRGGGGGNGGRITIYNVVNTIGSTTVGATGGAGNVNSGITGGTGGTAGACNASL